jgi:nucleoside 2-deoxyribosyltransferase
MPTCFVIQPFDRGLFDKRYVDIFKPAIEAAGLESYRVDQDPASRIPIEDIEAGIRRSDICLAEITDDNPNVWFELGFAIAARKPVIITCSEERQKFPFDVQHRTIIKYKTESASDFDVLRSEITRRLKAALERQAQLGSIENISATADVKGLTEHEIVALISIAASAGVDGDPVTGYAVKQEMSRAGYTDVACALALRGLSKKNFIERSPGYDGREEYWGYVSSELGLDWLETNQERLKLRFDEPRQADPGEDLPF